MVRTGARCLFQTCIKDVHKSLLKQETSVTRLCEDSLKLIAKTTNLNAFITVTGDEALSRAEELDRGLATNRYEGTNLLYGVPISVKDNFCTKNVLTSCGSKMLSNFVPPYNATVVERLLKRNCIIMGKTNMDEFAMGSSCTTSYYGPSANSWRSRLVSKPLESDPEDWFMAGGSSTGSAVSVANGSCFASLGTDTGGSTRQPASLTGLVGFKPTYGLISRFGLVPLAHCIDVVSILTRCVDDAKIVFDAIVGKDDNDLTTVDHNTELKRQKFNLSPGHSSVPLTIRVGVPESFIVKGDVSMEVSKSFQDKLSLLSARTGGKVNFEVINLSLPNSSLATECYTIISSAEIASNMSCYDGVKFGFSTSLDPKLEQFDRDQFFKANRDIGFGPEVKKRVLLGNYFLLSGNRARYFEQAMKLRRLITEEFERAFSADGIDVILMPSTPTTSVTYKEWLKKQDDNKLFREDYFLIPSNLANLPSISLPNGLSSDGLPFGLQLVANKFDDLNLISISRLFEAEILGSVNN